MKNFREIVTELKNVKVDKSRELLTEAVLRLSIGDCRRILDAVKPAPFAPGFEGMIFAQIAEYLDVPLSYTRGKFYFHGAILLPTAHPVSTHELRDAAIEWHHLPGKKVGYEYVFANGVRVPVSSQHINFIDAKGILLLSMLIAFYRKDRIPRQILKEAYNQICSMAEPEVPAESTALVTVPVPVQPVATAPDASFQSMAASLKGFIDTLMSMKSGTQVCITIP